MVNIASDNENATVRYKAVCSEGDFKGALHETKEEALQEAFRHQQENITHHVSVKVEQSGK